MNASEKIVEELGPLFRSSRPKFKGLLAEPLPPIVESKLGAAFGQPFLRHQVTSRASLLHKKLRLIMAHYELGSDTNDATNTRLLALHLLRDFVPGFQVADPNSSSSRRKKTWTPYRLSFLQVEMEKLLKSRRGRYLHNEKSAASALAKTEPWRSVCALNESREPAEVLRQRYSQAKRENSQTTFTAPMLLAAEEEGSLPRGTYDAALAELAKYKPEAIRFL